MLRPYQQRAVDMLRESIADRPICAMPTGSGKTHVAAEIIRLALSRGRPSLMVAHRRELIMQARDRLAWFGVQSGVIMPGHLRTDDPVQVGSIQTLIRRNPVPAELLLIDEAHHAVSASYMRLIELYPAAWIVGFTATPQRLDGRGLGEVFGRICEPVTMQELIDEGHLIEPKVFAPSAPDLAGLRKRYGEYSDMLELGERMSKLTGDIVEHYKKHADGEPTIAFACSVAHSIQLTCEMEAAGYRWEHLDGTSNPYWRVDVLRRLRAGEIHGVTNCEMFGEGVDIPTLRCAILARPTCSMTVHRQQIGRIMRPPGPAIVLDHAGNTLKHGLVTEDVGWSLKGRAKRLTEAVESVTTCPECHFVVPPGTARCPECGAEISKAPEIPIPDDGELTRYTVSVPKVDPREAYASLVRMSSMRGYKVGWARYRFYEQFAKWPRYYQIERDNYECPAHQWEMTKWGTRCARCRRKMTSVEAM